MSAENGPDLGELRARVNVIERDIDAGRYRPGPWARAVQTVRNQPGDVRAALAADITRVSRKLHLRNGRRTISVGAGLAIELAATVLGGLVLAIATGSNLAAIVVMLVWMMTFQPLVKVSVGKALGIGYDYVFLNGLEPRFKMRFGTYVAAARWRRIVLHLSGTVGSPLAAMIVALVADDRLRLASWVCWIGFWLLVAINLIPTVAALFGVRRLGPMKVGEGSGGSAAIELREALGL